MKISSLKKGLNTGWFISIGFALFDLQNQLINGTYSSLVASMIIALIILLFTSGNVIISLFAIVTISFSIAVTIAIFVFMGWSLSILESVIIIMSVGLSVDFSCHYGVAYINSDVKEFENTLSSSVLRSSADQQQQDQSSSEQQQQQQQQQQSTADAKLKTAANNKNHAKENGASCKLSKFVEQCIMRYRANDRERFARINDIFGRVGSAVLMAAFTTFLAGFSMYPSGLTSFSRMGQFLMLVMCTSYLYATFFFVPMCAIFGPTQNFGALHLKSLTARLFKACKPGRAKATAAASLRRHKSSNGKQKIISFNDNNNNNEETPAIQPQPQSSPASP